MQSICLTLNLSKDHSVGFYLVTCLKFMCMLDIAIFQTIVIWHTQLINCLGPKNITVPRIQKSYWENICIKKPCYALLYITTLFEYI